MSFMKDTHNFINIIRNAPYKDEWKLQMIEERQLLVLSAILDMLSVMNGIDTDEDSSKEEKEINGNDII